MLDFRLDEEQNMLVDAISRFNEDKVRKTYREAEESGILPGDVVQSGWEIGVLPTGLPEAYGGFGEYSVVTNAVAMEEFAWGDLATTLRIGAPNLVAIPVMLCGTDAQKEEFLPKFAAEIPPAMTAALTEPRIQFDPYNLQTTATKEGDNYILNGKKTFVAQAHSAELILIYANYEGNTEAFLVPVETTGFVIGDRNQLMGIQALETYAITLENVVVPAANRLGGEEGINFGLILNHSRIALGAMAVGMARAGFEYARDYTKQREQFGKPVAQNQSIAFMLADMLTDIDSCRMLVWEAAWKLDQGQDPTREVAVMKNYVDQLVLKVADSAVQALGGYGYIREYPVELWLRNARGFAQFDGLAII